MAKLKVSAELLSAALFRDGDKFPTIMGVEWDSADCCVILDIIGEGIPEGDVQISATFTSRTPYTVKFEII